MKPPGLYVCRGEGTLTEKGPLECMPRWKQPAEGSGGRHNSSLRNWIGRSMTWPRGVRTQLDDFFDSARSPEETAFVARNSARSEISSLRKARRSCGRQFVKRTVRLNSSKRLRAATSSSTVTGSLETSTDT